MLILVKDENAGDEIYKLVRTPHFAVPTAPVNVRNHIKDQGGEVIVLPSGRAIRLDTEKLNTINEAIDAVHSKGNKRKRKSSAMESPESILNTKGTTGPAFEILSKSALANMMPPPSTPGFLPTSHAGKMGLLGQQLMTPPPVRGSTPRGGGRRGSGGRGGRRPKSAPRMMMVPPLPMTPTSMPLNPGSSLGSSSTPPSINNLAILAQAINHQQEQEAANNASNNAPTSNSMIAMSSSSEPPQVAITPPKVVVVTTPSGTVLRTATSSSSTSSSPSETFVGAPSAPHIVASSNGPANPAGTTKTVKLKVGDSPMKVYPVGARILPKTASSSSGTLSTSNAPVFMVATSQNVMRVARTAAQTVTFTTGQRVVTASIRPPISSTGKPGSGTPTMIRALPPRVVTSVNLR